MNTCPKCPKCSGLMFLDRLSDFFNVYWSLGCFACGNRVDRTILANRQAVHATRKKYELLPQSHCKVGAR